MFQSKFANFIYAFLSVAATAGLCGYLNNFGLNTFYTRIDLPVFTPADVVFPVVWGILYALLIISLTLVLNTAKKNKRKKAVLLFWLNLLMQIIWTSVFFYSGLFLAGFIMLIILDFFAVLLYDAFHGIKKLAAYLLLPYLFWLLFATYLNWGIVDLNGYSYIF